MIDPTPGHSHFDMDSASEETQVPLRWSKVVATAAQGLAVGIATVTVAVFAAWSSLELVDQQPPHCYSDNPCLPDLRPSALAALTLLTVVVMLGPLFAWLLRLPSPWLFAIPAMWVFCLPLWLLILNPVGSVAFVAIVLASYPVVAVLGLLEADYSAQ